MKHKKLIIITMIIVIILSIVLFVFFNKKDKTKLKIVDESVVCPSALESIYEDDNYTYNLNCLKSDYVFVIFNSGEKITLKEALQNKRIKLEDVFKNDYYLFQKAKYELVVTKISNNDKIEVDGKSVFFKDVKIVFKNDLVNISLQEALNNKMIKITDIANYLDNESLLGLVIKNEDENNNITYRTQEYGLVKCSNNDYYFGENVIKIEGNMCK